MKTLAFLVGLFGSAILFLAWMDAMDRSGSLATEKEIISDSEYTCMCDTTSEF